MKGRGALPERRDGRAQAGVEPLSLKAWERVEVRLFERIERGELTPRASLASRALPHTPLWLGAAALVAAASVLLWWRFEAAPLLVAQAVSAAVHNSASAPPSTLTASPALDTGLARAEAAAELTRIVTTTAATATTIGEADVTLAAHSDVSFSGSDATGWLVQLERGQVDCHVAPRHGRPPFVVQAGDTSVSVVGTRFSVRREGSAVDVTVREGHVRVASGSLELVLGPGEQWPARLRASASRAPRVSPSERASERFERAARLEASDPRRALRLYGDLARSRGPWSANALYAQARLEFERGALAKAQPLLLRYLQRHPNGVNAGDVRKLLLEIDARHENP